MRRPLVGLFAAVSAGAWLGLQSAVAPAYCLFILVHTSVVAAVLAWRALCRPFDNGVPVPDRAALLVCVAGGAFCMAVCGSGAFPAKASDASLTVRPVKLRGVIAGEPELVTLSSEHFSTWHFPLTVEELRAADSEPRTASGVVLVRWTGGPESRPPAYGTRVDLAGRLDATRSRASGAVPCRFISGSRQTRVISRGHGAVLHGWALRLRHDSAAVLGRGLDDFPQSVAVIRALLLGYRAGLPPALRDRFARTGTLHVFAISGLHVGIVAVLLSVLLGAASVARTHWVLFVGPVLAMYTLATGAKPSAVRACIMAVLYYAAPLMGRRADALSALAAAALLIALAAPRELMDVGFILSFTVVTGLIALYPVVEGAMARAATRFRPAVTEHEADMAMLPASAGVVASTPALLSAVFRRLSSLLVLSVSAWLASAPLTAYYFGLFTPVSLIGNVAAIPLAFLSVLAGCLSIVLGQFALPVAEIFNHANLAVIGTLTYVTELLSRLPGGGIRISRPPAWSVWLWYAVLGGVVFAFHARDAGKVANRRQPAAQSVTPESLASCNGP